MNSPRLPVSGTQYDLVSGDYRATIASIGATLRTLSHAGRALVVPFEADELRPGYRGALLAPWPNRIVDGAYRFGGVDEQLPLTEPSRGHALHGLACWLDWQPIAQSADSVTLGTVIEPQAGYPHRLALTAVYTLSSSGLRTEVTAVNLGADDAPYGTAPHPYLVAGAGRVDDWSLELPAAQVLTVTEDRLIPTGLAEVGAGQGGEFDFRTARTIGDTFIDHAFTALAAGDDGRIAVRVRAADGSGVSMSWGAGLPWVQVHTADQPTPETNRLGLAVEPMTCPPDAFNSGTDLVVLAPGARHHAEWTIAAF